MEFVYLLICESEWEDVTALLSVADAIKESIKYPSCRVKVFSRKINKTGYTPSYNYYENSKYIENS